MDYQEYFHLGLMPEMVILVEEVKLIVLSFEYGIPGPTRILVNQYTKPQGIFKAAILLSTINSLIPS